jgi:adenylylsulfate kinase
VVRCKPMESHSRSIAKAVTYRVFGSGITALIVFLFTKNASASLGAGVADSVIKIGLYFLHERVWEYISFGRPKVQQPPEYEI